MITKLEIVSKQFDVSVMVDEKSRDYILEKADFGQVPGSFDTFKGFGQVGVYLSSASLESRDVTITGWIIASSYELLRNRKSKLNKIVNPLYPLTIRCYDEYAITGNPQQTIVYSPEWAENNNVMCKFMINLLCSDPCFYHDNENYIDIAIWQGNWRFPWVIASEEYIDNLEPWNSRDKGTIFGKRSPSLVGVIQNEGDTVVGMIIQFKATGEVVDPFVMNLTTQEIIKLNYTMRNGDTILVNTKFNEKSIVVTHDDGTTEDIFNTFEYDESTFIQLEQEGNFIRYGCTSGEDDLSVRIWWNPQYLEVQ